MNIAAGETQPSGAQTALAVKFTGTGREYFRIWIVNLLLTVLTLGIYSAWAKVRRLKYFYQNTQLAGSSFNYHGDPKAILKGRLLALGLLAVWNVAPLDRFWGIAVWLTLAATWPWILVRSMRFKRRNTSYRNVRFRFDGVSRDIYLPFALLAGISFIAAWAFYPGAPGEPKHVIPVFHAILGLLASGVLIVLAPHFHCVIQRFFVEHSLLGNARFGFSAGAWAFYKIYLLLGAVLVGGIVALGALFAASTGLLRQGSSMGFVLVVIGVLVIVYGFILFVGPYFSVRFQNLTWNNLSLQQNRFASRAAVWPLFRITLGNLFLTVLTLGLYRPFAVIRTLRYRVEAVTLLAGADLDSFVAGAETEVAAFAEETADLFDFDFAL